MRQAHPSGQTRERSRERHSGRHVHFVLGVRVLRKAVKERPPMDAIKESDLQLGSRRFSEAAARVPKQIPRGLKPARDDDKYRGLPTAHLKVRPFKPPSATRSACVLVQPHRLPALGLDLVDDLPLPPIIPSASLAH